MLERLEVDRLRNLRDIRLDLHPGLTVIAGHNGQGKTSVLEAIYLLATGRSFRTRRNDELIAWSGGPVQIHGNCRGRGIDYRIGVALEQGRRLLTIDRVERDLEAFLGHLTVVDLTAPRMDVLRGGPSERRRFLDRGILSARTAYLRVMADYRRSLQHRNALVRRRQGGPELDAWDTRLVSASIPLHIERRSFVTQLQRHVETLSPELLPPGRQLLMRYQPSPGETIDTEGDALVEAFAGRLAASRSRDLELGHTTVGPHRDELVVEQDGVDLRRFGSAGQVRGGIVAMKLSKLSLLREECGQAPLFLMDDFDTDLDEARLAALSEYLNHGEFQAIAATSKESTVEAMGGGACRLRMAAGKIHKS